jgi:serine/threonine-protein kinase
VSDSSTTDGASRLGQVVSGRYRIQKLLGEGGMGAVYLAEHTAMRKRVALKLLHKQVSDNQEVVARFEREGIASAKIEHPNVAAATDFGKTEDGSLFLVLEYLEGVSLREALASGPFPATRALHIARQIALALDRAHGAGIVHRDLKPENVMLVKRGDDNDFVKVLDFGIAKLSQAAIPEGADRSQPLTRIGTVLGTPEYMAPEQALGEAVTPPSDLYGLGVMLYEMLAGRHMFDPPDRMAMLSFHLVAPVPAIEDRSPGIVVAPAVEAVVRKLLEKDSKARYASGRELVAAIDAVSGEARISDASGGLAVVAPPSAPGSSRDGWKNSDGYAATSIGLEATSVPDANKTTIGGEKPGIVGMLRGLPRPVQIGLAAAIPLGLVFVVVAIILATRTTPKPGDPQAAGSAVASGSARAGATAPKVKRAPEDRLKSADTQGADALEALLKEFPDDPDVTKHLGLALASGGRNADAMRVIRTYLAASPQEATDPEIVMTVTSVATSANGEGADDAYALLEGPLGEKGVDVLIDISQRPRVYGRRGRTAPFDPAGRALKSLADPAVRAHASTGAGVLLDFRAAKGCAGKQAMFDRVKEAGDQRMLTPLKALRSHRGCGFAGLLECSPCPYMGEPLEDTIRAVEARGTK